MGEECGTHGGVHIYKEALTKLAQKKENTWKIYGQMGEKQSTRN